MDARYPNLAIVVRSRIASRRRRGFTFVELVLGMLVTTLVMGAVAALMSAVAQGWTQSAAVTMTATADAQVHLRLQKILRAARQLGYLRTGALDGSSAAQAAVLIWKGDANLDGVPQYSELAILEYYPSNAAADASTIREYQIVWPSSFTAAQKTANDTNVDSADNYNALYGVTLYNALMARPYLAYTIITRNVVGAEFHRIDNANRVRPALEYLVTLQHGTATDTEYGTVAERAPTTLPVAQR